MQTISHSGLLDDHAQKVLPYVVATWGDSRNLTGVDVSSSSDLYTDKGLQRKPALYWKLRDPTSSSTTSDFSGNALNGTVSGTVDFQQTGLLTETGSKSARFISNESSTVADSSVLNPNSTYTDWMIECWVKFNSLTAGEKFIIGKASGDGTASRQYEITYSGTTLTFKWYPADAAPTSYSFTSITIATGTLYYLAMIVKNGNFWAIVNSTIYGPTACGTDYPNPVGSFAVGKNGSSATPKNIEDAYIEAVAVYTARAGSKIVDPQALLNRYYSGINAGARGSTKYYHTADETSNGLEYLNFPWATLDAKDQNGNVITCDGRFYTVVDDYKKKNHEYGWFSKSLSDGSGNFSTAERITQNFDVTKANYVRVYKPDIYGQIKNYALYYKDTSDAWQTITASSNATEGTLYEEHNLGATYNITGLRIVINSTHEVTDQARIAELVPLYSEDISADIISVNIEKVRENYDSTVPLGITAANSAEIVVDNSTKKYSKYNSSSPIYGFVRPENKFDVQFRHSENLDGTGTQYYVKQGIYYADVLNMETSGMTTRYSCRDKSRFLQDFNVTEGFYWENQVAGRCVADLARYGRLENHLLRYQQRYVDILHGLRPVFHWRFNEFTKQAKAIYLNNQKLASYHINSYYYLDYIPELDSTTTLTVEFWVKSSSGTGIFFLMDTSTANKDVKMTNLGSVTIDINSSSYATAVSFQDGAWHHLALVVDTGASNKVVLYKDGASVYTSVTNPGSLNSKFENYWQFGNTTGINMRISDMRIWGKAKSQAEIRAQMNIALMGHETSLTSNWPIENHDDDGTNTIEYISSITSPSLWLADGNFNTPGITVPLESAPIMMYRDICFNGNITDRNDTSTQGEAGPLSNDSTSASALVDTSDDLRLPRNNKADSLTKMTFVGFIKWSSLASLRNIFHGDSSAAGAIDFYAGSDGSLNLEVNGTAGSLVTAASTVTTGTWYHIVLRVEKSGSTVNASIIVDNVSKASVTGSSSLYHSSPWFPAETAIAGDFGSNVLNGYISDWAIYDYILTDTQINDLYFSYKSLEQYLFPYLWTEEGSIWDNMLEIATPDLGLFFADELDYFNYEQGAKLFDPIYPQHANNQITINDSDYLINANEDIELSINKIVVRIQPTSIGNEIKSLWRANDNETLAATVLTNPLSETEVSKLYLKTISQPDGSYIPIFGQTGYVGVMDLNDITKLEIIKFNKSGKGYLEQLERAQFGTTQRSHPTNAFVGECRSYNIEFAEKPALTVQAPFSTSVSNGTARIHGFWHDTESAKMQIYADSSIIRYVYLEGTDPLTELVHFFGISGKAIEKSTQSDKEETLETELQDQIKRVGVKSLEIDNKFIVSKDIAQKIMNFLLLHYKNGVTLMNVDMMGLDHLQLGDRIRIGTFAPLGITNKDLWIMSISLNYDGGISQSMLLRGVS